MNIAFFLTPKDEVIWLSTDDTMRHAIEHMQKSGYTALPVLDREGGYAGTITEGDFLRRLMSTPDLSFSDSDLLPLSDVPLRDTVRPVSIDAEMEELFNRAIAQNFVPVIDSRGVFVGIVRRKKILQYCTGELRVKRATGAA